LHREAPAMRLQKVLESFDDLQGHSDAISSSVFSPGFPLVLTTSQYCAAKL
jgi:hypothetical protein